MQAGDLDSRLSKSVSPRVFCIADGYLEPKYKIQREEMERGLTAGWAMRGVSSIGALPAVNLGNAGMRGHGFVYRLLRRYSWLSANDICVLHSPFPPYTPETIPLVEIYALLHSL